MAINDRFMVNVGLGVSQLCDYRHAEPETVAEIAWRWDMSAVSPVRFRPTSRQVFGRAAWIGLVMAVVVAIPVIVLAVRGDLLWIEVLLVPIACIAGSLLAAPLLRRGGVDLDKNGVRPVIPGPTRREYAPWHRISEIRAERRGARTVPVIYLRTGKSWRLRVPYDGTLLGGDPQFDEKLSTMRNMWENHRRDSF